MSIRVPKWYQAWIFWPRPNQNWGWARRWNIIVIVAFLMMMIMMLTSFTMLSLEAAGFAKDIPWVRNLLIIFPAVNLVVIFTTYQRDWADRRQGEYIRILTGNYYDF